MFKRPGHKAVDTHIFFLENLDAEQARRERVNDDVHIVELACDCRRIVILFVFAPNDVNGVIANVPFLQNQ